MGLDLASFWVLSFFGACAVGGTVGFVLGKLLGFEFGLGVGLLVPDVRLSSCQPIAFGHAN